MPGAPGTHAKLTGTGNTTFSAGGRFKFDLSQLPALLGTGARRSYLRFLILHVDVTWLNGNVAARTLTWQKSYDLLKRIVLYTNGHVFYNLQFTGGQALRYLYALQFGRKPQASTDIVIAGGGGTTTQKLKFIIPFCDPRAAFGAKEDELVHVGVFNGGAQLEGDWSGTGEFGADVSVSAASVRALTVELIERDEVRFCPLWTVEERNQSSLQDFVTPEGNLYTDVSMCAVAAAGIAAPAFANADITQVTYTQNGRKIHDAITPADIIALYNAQQLDESVAAIPDFEGGTADLVPLLWLSEMAGKKTHLIPDLTKSQLTLQGALTISNMRLLLRYVKPTGPMTVAELARRSNEDLPAAFRSNPRKVVAAKTLSKQPVGMMKSKFLPQKIYSQGAPGMAA